jgi:hypothetical protein
MQIQLPAAFVFRRKFCPSPLFLAAGMARKAGINGQDAPLFFSRPTGEPAADSSS